jgi:hypothetical protein
MADEHKHWQDLCRAILEEKDIHKMISLADELDAALGNHGVSDLKTAIASNSAISSSSSSS